MPDTLGKDRSSDQIGEGEEDESHPRLGRGRLSHGLAFPYGGPGGGA